MTLPLQTCHTLSNVHFLQFHRFRFAIARLPETRTRSQSCLSHCSLQPECRVNPRVKIDSPNQILGDFNGPLKSCGKVTAKAKTELKQKIMDFYNCSVTARRGHKKRFAQPGYPNLRAIVAWDQALQSATRGLGMAAFSSPEARARSAEPEDADGAPWRHIRGTFRSGLGTPRPRDTRPPRLWEHRHAEQTLLVHRCPAPRLAVA